MNKKPIIIKNVSSLTQSKKSIPEYLMDQWVNNSKDHEVNISNSSDIDETRLTLLIPKYLHRRIKKYCASYSLSMKKKIIEVLEKEFPEN